MRQPRKGDRGRQSDKKMALRDLPLAPETLIDMRKVIHPEKHHKYHLQNSSPSTQMARSTPRPVVFVALVGLGLIAAAEASRLSPIAGPLSAAPGGAAGPTLQLDICGAGGAGALSLDVADVSEGGWPGPARAVQRLCLSMPTRQYSQLRYEKCWPHAVRPALAASPLRLR